MRLASAGLAPAVEIAMAIGPERTMAGRMKLQSGGTSTTLHSIDRRSASSKTAMFDVGARGRGDREEVALEVARRERPLGPLEVAGRREGPDVVARLRSDHVDVGVAGQEALGLLEPDVARADDQAAAAGQLQAGDVERRVEHVGDAALVAQLEPVLAHARLPSVGLSGHGRMVVGKIVAPCPTADPRTSSFRP